MKSPLKLGLADYVLIALTCLLVLLFVERWNAPVEDWLREITREEQPGSDRTAAPDVPDVPRDWLDLRKEAPVPSNSEAGQ